MEPLMGHSWKPTGPPPLKSVPGMSAYQSKQKIKNFDTQEAGKKFDPEDVYDFRKTEGENCLQKRSKSLERVDRTESANGPQMPKRRKALNSRDVGKPLRNPLGAQNTFGKNNVGMTTFTENAKSVIGWKPDITKTGMYNLIKNGFNNVGFDSFIGAGSSSSSTKYIPVVDMKQWII